LLVKIYQLVRSLKYLRLWCWIQWRIKSILRKQISTIIHSRSHDSLCLHAEAYWVSNWPYTPPLLENGNGNGNGHLNGSGKPPSTTQAVILGLGSMFNHSNKQQNVGWERDLTHLLVTYTALRDIRKGEELCISYGSRLTFKDMDGDGDSFEMEPDDMEEWLNYTDLID